MGTGKKGVCIARGGSQKAGGRGCGHFKQSRVAGSAKQGSSTQGQCMASRWGKQGCRAATQGAGGCRILGKGGEKEGSVDGPWASCLPATPPGVLGVRNPGLLPTKPFRSPTLSSMELLPCIACVLCPGSCCLRKTTSSCPAQPQGQGQRDSSSRERSLGTSGGQAQRGGAEGCFLSFMPPEDGAIKGARPQALHGEALNKLNNI